MTIGPFQCFRVHSWPAGWTINDDYPVQRRNGYGLKIGVWTYFFTWGRGPFLI